MEILLQDRNILLLVSAVFGSIFGSFATALVYRMPRDINWISKRSECTNCKTKLRFLDLIPIFSYLIRCGKCKYCGIKYGVKYFVIELLVTTSFVLPFYFLGATLQALILVLLSFTIIVLSVIDFEHFIIPDEVNIFIFLLGSIYSYFSGKDFIDFFINCSGYFLLALFLRWVMFIWKKKEGLGFGDVKFFLATGSFLSLEMLPVFLFVSGAAGLVLAIIWKVFKKSEIFPFGPALSLSLFLCVAFPESNLYLNDFVQHYIYLK